jgi:hypothetical protein
MKKLVLLMVLVCSAIAMSAQKTVYASVQVFDKIKLKSSCIEAVIDLGSNMEGYFGIPVNEEGEVIEFETEMAVLNWMAERGWEYVEFNEMETPVEFKILTSIAKEMRIKRYIFTKTINDFSEVKKGILLVGGNNDKKSKNKRKRDEKDGVY